MPHYRFVLRGSDESAERAEEFGIFNDEGAVQFACRYGHGSIVEVWEQQRLVGRVEAGRALIDAG